VTWYQAAQDEQYVLLVGNRAKEGGTHAAQVDIHGINVGGLGSEITFEELFDDLDLGHMHFFFISTFVFLILLLSFINPWNKRLSILFFSIFFVFLQSLADVTPVHGFLYKHIYFYRLFRNYFFFLPLIIPLIILFAVEQFRLFLKHQPAEKSQRVLLILFTVFIHIFLTLFLLSKDHIIFSTYLTLAGSLILFSLYFSVRLKSSSKTFMALFVFVAALQPLQTCYHYALNKNKTRPIDLKGHIEPKFSFSRPYQEIQDPGYFGYRGSYKRMEDESGFLKDNYFGVKWSHFLHENMDHAKIKDYVRYKFFIYDQVEYGPEEKVDLRVIESALMNQENRAFVVHPESGHTLKPIPDRQTKAHIIKSNSEEFQVIDFGLNFIKFKTNFPARKFIVYNDSFHKGWWALVNGKKQEILRANVAFKGLWLQKGENTVSLRFGRPGHYYFNIFLIVFFMFFLFILLNNFVRHNDLDTQE